MKILIISSYKDTWNSVRPEAEIFIGLVKLGVDVTLMTQGDAEYVPRFEENGVKIIDFHPTKKLQWSSIKRIRAELKRGDFDLCYMFNNKAIANGLFASIGVPLKMISYRGQTGNISRYDPTCYLTHLNPRLDGISCVANAVRDDLRAQSSLPETSITTIYKGHALDWYKDVPVDLAQFGIPDGAFTVVCVANDRPRKGVPVLLEATQKLGDCESLHLLLVGKGMDSDAIQALIASSPMKERIHCAGFRKDAPAIVASCSASVLASTKREGLPKTVIESMAYAVAPIVTDTGGNAELVEDGRNGLVVKPSDSEGLARAIQTLYNDKALTERFGKASQERLLSHFSSEESARATKSFFEEILRKN